ncbi:MAG: alpha/beta hydrolase [Chitinophagaceae bacterium]
MVKKNCSIQGIHDRAILYDVFEATQQVKDIVIVYIHGFNGFKDWGSFDLIGKHFQQSGYHFVKFNTSHNGTTLSHPEEFVDLEAYGNNNYSKEIADTKTIIWHIKNELFTNSKPIRIALLGHSKGGGVATLVASQMHEVDALITWASVAHANTPFGQWNPKRIEQWKAEGVFYYHNKRTHQKMPIYYQLYEDYMAHQQEYDIQKALKDFSKPHLIQHGTLDEAVPFSTAQLLHSWNPKAVLKSYETNHVFDRKHPWTLGSLPTATLMALQDMQLFLAEMGL